MATRMGAHHVIDVEGRKSRAEVTAAYAAAAGADVVIDTAGGAAIHEPASTCCGPADGSRLRRQPRVLPGFTTFPMYYKEISIIGSRALTGPRHGALDRSGRLGTIDVSGFVARAYPLDRTPEAFEEYERNPGKVLAHRDRLHREMKTPMNPFIVPITSIEADERGASVPRRPTSRSGTAGLPIPDGFCLDADAYRFQIAALGLEATARAFSPTEEARRRGDTRSTMKLGLMDSPLRPRSRTAARRMARAHEMRTARYGRALFRALVEDRFGSSFAGQFESFLGLESEADFHDRRALVLGRAVVDARACATWRRTISIRPTPRWAPGPAAGLGACLGRRLSRTAEGGMCINGHVGTGLRDRAGRSHARPLSC